MADNSVVKNRNYAPFVDEERAAGEADIYPGNFVFVASDGDVQKHAAEGDSGQGLMADLSLTDPTHDKTTAYASGEVVSLVRVPIGGTVDARLAPGADITTASEPDVAVGDLLVETVDGGLAQADSDTIGSPQGPVYRALEAVDNSGGSAGVANQVPIEVVRIA